MKAVFPQTIYLKDYAAPAYLVDDVQHKPASSARLRFALIRTAISKILC